MVIVITHWNFCKYGRHKNPISIKDKIEEFKVEFNRVFHFLLEDDQFVFIDNNLKNVDNDD